MATSAAATTTVRASSAIQRPSRHRCSTAVQLRTVRSVTANSDGQRCGTKSIAASGGASRSRRRTRAGKNDGCQFRPKRRQNSSPASQSQMFALNNSFGGGGGRGGGGGGSAAQSSRTKSIAAGSGAGHNHRPSSAKRGRNFRPRKHRRRSHPRQSRSSRSSRNKLRRMIQPR